MSLIKSEIWSLVAIVFFIICKYLKVPITTKINEKSSDISDNIKGITVLIKDEIPLSSSLKKGRKKFTPPSRRQLIPDAISWLLKYHPELSDPQIAKLIGTTKNTINSIKSRDHWNIQNITPRDPVLLALCTQSSLTEATIKAKKKLEKLKKISNEN